MSKENVYDPESEGGNLGGEGEKKRRKNKQQPPTIISAVLSHHEWADK